MVATRQNYCYHWAYNYGLMEGVVHIGVWFQQAVVVVPAQVMLFQLESG